MIVFAGTPPDATNADEVIAFCEAQGWEAHTMLLADDDLCIMVTPPDGTFVLALGDSIEVA